MTALLERLRARYTEGSREEHLVNPYGPAAADTIEQQAARIESMAREIEGLRAVLAPFVDLGAQNGAWGVIDKKLDGMAPVTVTVTKDQMRAACIAALAPGMEDMNDG